MDSFVADFYASIFKDKYQLDIGSNSKAYVKLVDAIQKERTVLSANT